jgi:hypothetical protein
MKAIKKIVYIILSLSLIPVLNTYFAYGSKLEMGFFIITLIFFLGIIYLLFSISKTISATVFFIGAGLLIIQFRQLYTLWFDNEGGVLIVPLIFTAQSLLTIIVEYFLLKDSQILERFKKKLK